MFSNQYLDYLASQLPLLVFPDQLFEMAHWFPPKKRLNIQRIVRST